MRELENLDDSVEIRGFYFKQKLKARYHSLQFLKPIKGNAFQLTRVRINLIWRNWITGSSYVVEFGNFVETGDDVRQKLLSVAQDSIYIFTKGRKPMHKHVALGLTMRNMNGSSNLIGILNGLGHSVSHSTVLEHDTALAKKQLCTEFIVPEWLIKITMTSGKRRLQVKVLHITSMVFWLR